VWRLAVATLLAAGFAPFLVDSARAQDRTRIITGTVVDSVSTKPLAQAEIFVGRTSAQEHTGKDGTFRVPAAQGPVVLMVRRAGYVPVFLTAPGDTAGSETDVGTARLRPVKTDADRAALQAADVRAFPELARFYQDKAAYPQGLFFTPDDLERMGGALLPFIRQKPNFRFICFVNRKHEVDCGQELSRGPTSIMRGNPASREQEPCELEVWTNGGEPFRQTLDNILVDAVLAAEAFSNPGVTPPPYKGSPCAALILYMKETGP
jgi:hypothetical protein